MTTVFSPSKDPVEQAAGPVNIYISQTAMYIGQIHSYTGQIVMFVSKALKSASSIALKYPIKNAIENGVGPDRKSVV